MGSRAQNVVEAVQASGRETNVKGTTGVYVVPRAPIWW